MDIELTKNIATIAAPFTKVILDTFLAPKLNDVREKWKRQDKIIDHSFENKFIDYLNETYEKNAILNTIAFKKRKVLLNEVYIPLTLHCEDSIDRIIVEGYNEEIFKNSNKILITDTAGMGKSTLSRKILLSIIEKNVGIPILVELRRLTKHKDIVDEIIEKLNPINEELDKNFILDLIKRGDFIFFLDGFDEISITERSKVTSDIQTFVSKAKNNKFILTSRPEDALSSFGEFQKFQIMPLKLGEAFELIKKYDPTTKISDLLIKKIEDDEILRNIEEYLTTPLLVSLLYTAFEHKQSIPFKKHIFYRQVFDALFESHDLSKGDSFERDKFTKLGSDEFHRVLRIFGFLCLKNENKIEFSKDELNSIIQSSIEYCPELQIKPNDLIKDLLITVPLFSKDGIYYKWSHKSLQEYFAAQYIFFDAKEKQNDILKHICFHDNNVSFLNTLELYNSIDPSGFEKVVVLSLLKNFLDYCSNSYINYTGDSVLERQELTFGHEVYLINFPFESFFATYSEHQLLISNLDPCI
jgi:predicted NACHT family NTPase